MRLENPEAGGAGGVGGSGWWQMRRGAEAGKPGPDAAVVVQFNRFYDGAFCLVSF
jgi:hypothetical protein